MRVTNLNTVCIFLLAGVASIASQAQSFYNKNSTVSVLAGTIFSVGDSLVNTGVFVNNGNLLIGGTWLNTGTYNAGAGEITFNSTSLTAPQIINHSNQSFSKLTISGGGRKLILADITIEDELVLDDGVIENENNARVIINPSATIAGGSDQSHIHAPVYHQGSGEKFFPLGNGSAYLPVRILDVSELSGPVGVEGIELQKSFLLKAPTLDGISTTRYWKIEVAGGSLNARIELPVRDENLEGGFDNLVVAESQALTEPFISAGNSFAEGTISSGVVTSERAISSRFVALASASDNGFPVVYNAVSSNNDGLNDFLTIGNIEFHPENKFTLFNRWGDKIFEMENYDNATRVFRGKSNIGGEKDLVNGTYFYILETSEGMKLNGFLVLKN